MEDTTPTVAEESIDEEESSGLSLPTIVAVAAVAVTGGVAVYYYKKRARKAKVNLIAEAIQAYVTWEATKPTSQEENQTI